VRRDFHGLAGLNELCRVIAFVCPLRIPVIVTAHSG
jgi:hypothetical protein